jgi:hypothetical protein
MPGPEDLAIRTDNGPSTYGERALRSLSVRADVRCVNLDADALPDQSDRDHQPRVRTFPHQSADHPAEWTPLHLDHLPFVNQWARVVSELSPHERSDAFDLMIRNARRAALK